MIYIMFWLPQYVSKPTPALNFYLAIPKGILFVHYGPLGSSLKAGNCQKCYLDGAFYLACFFV